MPQTPHATTPRKGGMRGDRSWSVGAAISLVLRGGSSCDGLSCNNVGVSLYDHGLNDLLFVGVEDLGKILVELGLFLLEF